MSSNLARQIMPKAASIALRLRAHARLCEEIARECCDEVTAEKLKRMAQECSQAAAVVARPHDNSPQTRH